MRFISGTYVILSGFLLLCGLVPLTSHATPQVSEVRLGLHTDMTRFVIEVSEKPDYRIFYLANPYRIVIDMPEVDWKAPANGDRSVGIIETYRYGLFRKGTSRIVLDLAQPGKIIRRVALPPTEGKPYRFFVDVQKTDPDTFNREVDETRRQQLAALPPAMEVTPQPESSRKLTVVIDAGHGGIDPGAIGRSGVHEKQLTLEVARRLHAQLQKNPRFSPVLTRDTDVFLSLKERVSFARKAEADLFVSIHADSIARSDVRGTTVYTLSETASDVEAAALAATNNKSDVIAGVDLDNQDDTVQGILIDLAQRETMNFSIKFAKLLIPELVASGMPVGSRSHRFAGFRVLKAPDVPSVLVELGYLSNATDERILRSSSGQAKLAQAIATAIDSYFKKVEP